jgi:DNA-binding NarL/FixJ family response regulator
MRVYSLVGPNEFPATQLMSGLQTAEPTTVERPPSPALTTREVTVLKLMADRLSGKQIAASLGISFKTVVALD